MEFHGGLAGRLLDEFPLKVAVLDDDGEILWVNRAWDEFGREQGLESGSVGVNYLDVTAAADDPYARRAAAGIAAVLGGERSTFSLEYPCHSRLELRWYAMRATGVEFEGRNYCLVAHEDVTDRTVSELLTRARREEAAAMNRMFTHELRNAVGSAAGWLDTLDTDTDTDQAARVERIASALDRIDRAVGDSSRLLDLAHEQQSLERVPVESLASAAWERADRGGTSLDVADRFPVICYPRQTEALFESLFDDATAEPSVTTVRVRLGTGEFYVEDDRSEPVPTDPDPAFTETPIHRGGRLSLGLSLARPLAMMNGWDLSLDPAPRPLDGWRFTLLTRQTHD